MLGWSQLYIAGCARFTLRFQSLHKIIPLHTCPAHIRFLKDQLSPIKLLFLFSGQRVGIVSLVHASQLKLIYRSSSQYYDRTESGCNSASTEPPRIETESGRCLRLISFPQRQACSRARAALIAIAIQRAIIAPAHGQAGKPHPAETFSTSTATSQQNFQRRQICQ